MLSTQQRIAESQGAPRTAKPPVLVAFQVHHGFVDHVTHFLLEKEVSLVGVPLLFLRLKLLPAALHVLLAVSLGTVVILDNIVSREEVFFVLHFQIFFLLNNTLGAAPTRF